MYGGDFWEEQDKRKALREEKFKKFEPYFEDNWSKIYNDAWDIIKLIINDQELAKQSGFSKEHPIFGKTFFGIGKGDRYKRHQYNSSTEGLMSLRFALVRLTEHINNGYPIEKIFDDFMNVKGNVKMIEELLEETPIFIERFKKRYAKLYDFINYDTVSQQQPVNSQPVNSQQVNSQQANSQQANSQQANSQQANLPPAQGGRRHKRGRTRSAQKKRRATRRRVQRKH